MTLPVFRTGTFSLAVLAIVIAALGVFSNTNTALAVTATYDSTMDYQHCNRLPTNFPTTSGYTDPDLAGPDNTGPRDCTSYDTDGDTVTDQAQVPANSSEYVSVEYVVPQGDSNFSFSPATMISDKAFVAADADIPDGTKVGGFISTVTLGILNGTCQPPSLTVEFILFDSETDPLDTVDTLPEGTENRNLTLVTDWESGTNNGTIGVEDDSFIDGYEIINGRIDIDRDKEPAELIDPDDTDDDGTLRGKTVTDGKLDMDGDTVAGETDGTDDGVLDIGTATVPVVKNGQIDGTGDFLANVDSPFVDKNPSFYVNLWDPDLDFQGGPNGGLNVQPLARYTGVTKVSGIWQILSFFQFAPYDLQPFAEDADNYPSPLGFVGTTPYYISQSILNDPTEVLLSPSTISDFCTPLRTEVMLLGQTPDGCDAGGNPDPGNTFPCTRGKTPSSAGQYEAFQYSYGLRDDDADGIENNFDTCPFNAVTGSDDDSDGIGNECDTVVNNQFQTCAVEGTSASDQDCDGFSNRQDICPQTITVDQADIIDGDIDIDEDGTVDATDDLRNVALNLLVGAPDQVDIIDGQVDVNEDGTVDASDDLADVLLDLAAGGTDQVDIIDGQVDVDESGTIVVDTLDDLANVDLTSLTEKNSENQNTYANAAPDGGPRTDALGDNCDPNATTSINEGGWNDETDTQPLCYGKTDNDQDGWCFGPGLPDPDDGNAAVGSSPDEDFDGWSTADETALDTDPLDKCADNTGGAATGGNEVDDQWPPDFNDTKKVDIVDVLAIKPVFGQPSSEQVDIINGGLIDVNEDGSIDGSDDSPTPANQSARSVVLHTATGGTDKVDVIDGKIDADEDGTAGEVNGDDDITGIRLYLIGGGTVTVNIVNGQFSADQANAQIGAFRYDLIAGGGATINIVDVLAVKPVYNKKCSDQPTGAI